MYISNITHFLDDEGNIAQEMPKQAREMAGFLSLIIDAATLPKSQNQTPIKCLSKKCKGIIQFERTGPDSIHWRCNGCSRYAGIISGWRGTKFDNTRIDYKLYK